MSVSRQYFGQLTTRTIDGCVDREVDFSPPEKNQSTLPLLPVKKVNKKIINKKTFPNNFKN
jgi:hypothetical protein